MSLWKLVILGGVALLYRYFYGREVDALSFFQTWMIGLCLTVIVLLYQILKRVDEIKEGKDANAKDDFEV